jgi:hypothetical protein
MIAGKIPGLIELEPGRPRPEVGRDRRARRPDEFLAKDSKETKERETPIAQFFVPFATFARKRIRIRFAQ